MQSHSCETFSTAGMPVRQRLARWVEFGSQTLSEMSVDPVDPHTFEASLSRVELGELGFCWMRTTPATAQSDSSHIGPWAAPMQDSVLLIVQDSGRCWMDHCGWAGELAPGDLVFRSPTSPWRTRILESTSMIFVKIPTVRLAASLGDFDLLRGAPLKYAQGRSGLAASVIRSIQRAFASDTQDTWTDDVADLILDSVKISCRGQGHDGRSDGVDLSRQHLRREICFFIEKNLTDPEFGAATIAAQFSLNPRVLQRLFAEVGQTASRYILERRLARAAKMLRQLRRRTITDIAYSVGFNELSYFCRRFTAHFGATPRAYRKH